MQKERKQRVLRPKHAITPIVILMLLTHFGQSLEAKWPIARAFLGGRADCPPADTSGTYAAVITDAGTEDTGLRLNPNHTTYRTLNAAAQDIYERTQKGHRPDLVVLLNGIQQKPDQNINAVYRNRLNGFLGYYSHNDPATQIPDNSFRFSNRVNTKGGIDDLVTILQENNIRNIVLYSSPQAERAAIMTCARGIPTTIIDVEETLDTHTSKIVRPLTRTQEVKAFTSWMNEKAKLAWMFVYK